MKTKTCLKCKATKPTNEFYKHPGMADGYLNQCKQCKIAYQHNHRADNLKKVRAYDRMRGRTSKRKALNMARQNANLESHRIASLKWSRANKHKMAASLKVNRAIKAGTLTKNPCEICETSNRIEGHHEDYNRPLDVRWLCYIHHKKEHRIYKEAPCQTIK